MRKIKKILVGIITMALLSSSAMVAFAEEASDMNAVASAVEESQLGQIAVVLSGRLKGSASVTLKAG